MTAYHPSRRPSSTRSWTGSRTLPGAAGALLPRGPDPRAGRAAAPVSRSDRRDPSAARTRPPSRAIDPSRRGPLGGPRGCDTGGPAAMPAAWMARTVRAAIAFTGGPSAAVGMVSAQAVVLAEGVLNVMFLKKLGMVATSLVILGGFAAGGGVWARQEAARTSPAPLPPIAPAAGDSAESNPPEASLLASRPGRCAGQGRHGRTMAPASWHWMTAR